jgi:hypothetical protein
MLAAMLPAAAADGIQAKGSRGSIPIGAWAFSYKLNLPETSKPAQKIIPRRCITVRQGDYFTIPVIVSPASYFSLNDLLVMCDYTKIYPVPPTTAPKLSGSRVTIYPRFQAVGKPTDTTKMSYYSYTRAAEKSRTYVTIVPQPVTGVTVDPTSAILHVGGLTQQLTATVLPATATNKAVRWYSTNPKVATVSSTGLVTPLAVGNATIYVVTKSRGKKAKCAITVEIPAD